MHRDVGLSVCLLNQASLHHRTVDKVAEWTEGGVCL